VALGRAAATTCHPDGDIDAIFEVRYVAVKQMLWQCTLRRRIIQSMNQRFMTINSQCFILSAPFEMLLSLEVFFRLATFDFQPKGHACWTVTIMYIVVFVAVNV
jgi:hypothetical protein